MNNALCRHKDRFRVPAGVRHVRSRLQGVRGGQNTEILRYTTKINLVNGEEYRVTKEHGDTDYVDIKMRVASRM